MSSNKEREASAVQMESGQGYKSASQPPPDNQQYPGNAQNAYQTTNNAYALPPNHPPYPPAPVTMVMERNIEAGQQYRSMFIASIIVTVLCCWPIGILAIQNARKAKDFAELNQPELAEEHASKAKRYMVAATVAGFICIGIIVAVVVLRIMIITGAFHN